MCGHKQIGIWEMSKITVVDSNIVNHWLMTGAINIPGFLSEKINGLSRNSYLTKTDVNRMT